MDFWQVKVDREPRREEVPIRQETFDLNLSMAKARGFLTGLTQPSRGSFRAQQ